MKRMLLFCSFICTIFSICFIDSSSSIIVTKNNELPRLYFEGNLEELVSKKDQEKIKISYVSDTINFDGYASIKLQGSSSLNYDKKNYNIKFYEDKYLNNELVIDFGWGAQYKYCLKANWIDKTHSRNIVTANLVANIQKKFGLFDNTPNNGVIDGFPIEIYLNDKFLGLYTLNIPKDAWMFNMDENNENHLVFSTTNWSKSVSFYETANFTDWELEVGLENAENLKKLNRLIDFVMNSSDEDFKNNIDDYFNLDSLLNYYVMLEVAHLVDNTSKNMLLVTYDGKIWYTSLYDLDSSWGTSWNGIDLVDYSQTYISLENNLWKKLKNNFTNELVERYFYLRSSILTEENIMSEFYSFYNSIPENSLKKELKRWNYIPGYDLEQIKIFLDIKLPLLDKTFSNMYKESNVFVRLYKQYYIY